MSWGRVEFEGRAGWAATLAELQSAGVALPLGLAVLDLRWWQDRILAPGSTVTLPSLTELAERWGWRSSAGKLSVKRVRLLLKDEALWCDPYRLDEWRAHRGHDWGTTGARSGHDEGTIDKGETPNIGTQGHGEGTTRARPGHDQGNARVPSSTLTLTLHAEHEVVGPAEPSRPSTATPPNDRHAPPTHAPMQPEATVPPTTARTTPDGSEATPNRPTPHDPVSAQRRATSETDGRPAEPSETSMALPGLPPTPPKLDPAREAWQAAATMWGQQCLPAAGRKPSPGPELRSKVGQRLLVAVRKDADRVLDALRFFAESQHSRAEYVRGQGYNLETVLRHVDEYADLWREFGSRPVLGGGPRRQGPSAMPPPTSGDGALDRLWARIHDDESEPAVNHSLGGVDVDEA